MTRPWRSLQYVPAHSDKHVASARIQAADAVILDLEDAVAGPLKGRARAGLVDALASVSRWGGDVLVRVNAEDDLLEGDVTAAVDAGAMGIVLPKADSPRAVEAAADLIAAAEAGAGRAADTVVMMVLVESARGVLAMPETLAASSRVVAVNLGNEDLAADLGVEPCEAALQFARQQMVVAAAANGVTPLGLIGAATRYDDLDAYEALARRSRTLGMTGSTCIHPSQIAVLNAVFSPTEDELRRAEAVLAAAQAGDGGAFGLNGVMIDLPAVRRAKTILERNDSLKRRVQPLI
ncbi:HpcH/HpaI aldolase/citrate lyase family protein [Brevundimonas sp. UBA7534]|uniref:HpcH/HpaI aldolase/citrate lyase family protein n=1 Tax=Brevundimonas sp. UBA7534 TaxID=1946138 RepID=UPI0025C1F584|nr:CoA ester lyase [Brevundimonas sp. UBA7534]